MHRLATALLIASLPLTARADDDAPKGDLAKLQGTWAAKVPFPDGEVPLTIEFSGSKITLKGTHDGDEFDIKGEVRIDEKASPKTIDWVKLVDPGGDEIPERPSVYKFDGDDTLIICSNAPGAPRPTEIKKGADGPLLYITFRRKKDDEKKDAKADDLAKLQGEWKTMIGPNKDRPVTFSIKDKALSVKFTTGDGETLDLKGEIALNESGSPRTIDFVKFKNGGDDMDDSHGLYKVEGDTFTLCVAAPGEPRPAEFKAGDGDAPPHLWTFTQPK